MTDFNPENYEIIDVHVHPVSMIPGTGFQLFDQSLNEEEFVAELRRVGISRCSGAVVRRFQPGELTSFNQLHQLNIAALEFRDRYPDFFIPGITVHPKFPEESCREIEIMHRDFGVNLVGELVAYMMDYNDYTVSAMNPVWDLIRELDMALNIHINSIEEASAMLRNFPDLKLIIAHPTASPFEYTDRLNLIRRYPNAALDISGSGPNSWRMLRHGINLAGKEKLLFGTDFPLRNPGMYVAGVYAERLAPDEMRAIFAGNFRRLVQFD